MMDGGFASRVVDGYGIGRSDYLKRKRDGSLSASSPLLSRHIKSRMSSGSPMEGASIGLSRQSSALSHSERAEQGVASWSDSMDVDSGEDQSHNQDEEYEGEGSSDMDISG